LNGNQLASEELSILDHQNGNKRGHANPAGGDVAREAAVRMIEPAIALVPGSATDLSPSGVNLPLSPFGDPSWLLVEEGFNLVREHEIESIFTVANGYIGTRASLEEGSRLSQPSTFVSGIYTDDPASKLGPALLVLPDWPHLEIAVDGDRLSMESGRVIEHRRMLDLRQGVLWREWRQQDSSGRITRVRFLRLASLADRHVLLQSVAVTVENYAGRIEFVAGLTLPNGPGEHGRLTVTRDLATVVVLGRQTSVAMATGSVVQPKSEATKAPQEYPTDRVDERWSWEAGLGETVRLDRVVAVYTSRDVADPTVTTRTHVARIQERGVPALTKDHVDAWRRRWDAAEVQIFGDDEAQRILRFAVYHLMAAANPDDEHASIGARGLTGQDYRGHVFWDTEIYMLPFYLFTDPPAARALLMYRFHTLGAARRKAQEHGYQGDLYAWESADSGEETTPRTVVAPDGRVISILSGEQEHHISADIAYAVWQYWRATADDKFMVDAGADILVETARFWASRARVEVDGHAHIRAVMGPDEYHETIDDNAYTNVMARWNLNRAADAVAILEQEQPADWKRLSARLALTKDEPAAWRRVAAALVTGFDPDTGLFEQFEGYFGLEEIDVIEHRSSVTPIDVYLGRERTRQSKAIKQADVVALSALLWDEWPRAVHEANFNYYEPRTAHGSSLSPALHALVAARLSEGALARSYMWQAGEIDLANNMGNAAGGVHIAALGGLWQAVVFGVAGVRFREDGIALDPHLLPGWSEIRCSVQWRGRVLRLTLAADTIRIEVAEERSGELTLAIVDGPECRAIPGRHYVIGCEGSAWGTWREADK
jgi:trehalose/maltose hydrolase-like predicted phosphorylase